MSTEDICVPAVRENVKKILIFSQIYTFGQPSKKLTFLADMSISSIILFVSK